MSAVPNFGQWLKQKLQLKPGQMWVLRRRTPRILDRYGDDVICLTQKQYSALEEEHRVLRRDEVLLELASKHNFHRHDVLREAFEAGRTAR